MQQPESAGMLATRNQANVFIYAPTFTIQAPDRTVLNEARAARPTFGFPRTVGTAAIGYIFGLGVAMLAKPLLDDTRSMRSAPVGGFLVFVAFSGACWHVGGAVKALPEGRSHCVLAGKMVGIMAAAAVVAITNYL